MIIVNTSEIAGKKVAETLGIVRGSSVRTKWFGADFLAGLKNIVGGELEQYVKLMEEAREIALNKMKEDASDLGADAIINVRFTTSQIAPQAAEILVYGTAVKLR